MAVTVGALREYANIPDSIDDAILQQYIDFAHVIVTEDMANCPMTPERREMIELNLAAHFASQSVQMGISNGLSQMKIGQSEERYATLNDTNFGLAVSRFGQIAIMLDPCGILVEISTPRMKARFQVV